MKRAIPPLTALIMALTVTPAHAATQSFADPSLDTANNGPDLTKVVVDNSGDRVKVTVRIAAPKLGSVIVAVQTKGSRKYVAGGISRHRTRVQRMFFTATSDGFERSTCQGWRAVWPQRSTVATLSIPRHCLANPGRGPVRVWALSENTRYADSDYLGSEQETIGWTSWVARG